MSAYAASKLAAIKVMEYIGAETDPGVLRILSVHPGIVSETEGGQKMTKESGIAWEGDDSKNLFFSPTSFLPSPLVVSGLYLVAWLLLTFS